MGVVTRRSSMTFYSDGTDHYSHRVRIVLADFLHGGFDNVQVLLGAGISREDGIIGEQLVALQALNDVAEVLCI